MGQDVEAFETAAAPLRVKDKVAYGLGSTAEALVFTTTSSFTLLFYNQVRGLDAGLIGTALAVGLFVNAFVDPIIGSWSDRTRSRWGRRHPFMFGAILPAAVLFYALFNPPDWGATGQLIWVGVTNTLLLQVMTIYHTPHLALGGELSQDYLGRTSVMASTPSASGWETRSAGCSPFGCSSRPASGSPTARWIPRATRCSRSPWRS